MVKKQTENIRETRNIALLTLTKLAKSQNNQTGRHLERIAEYSLRLAESLRVTTTGSINGDFIAHLYKSSLLHDIGKVGIPDSVLLKQGPLTPDEWAVMRTHTTIGGDTLREVIGKFKRHTFLAVATEIAYSHHERWDGGGYPAGLAGEAILLSARLVALADAYDAITSERPYKPAFDHSEAIRRITIDRRCHFDPAVVNAFLACQQDFARIQARLQDRHLAARTAPA